MSDRGNGNRNQRDGTFGYTEGVAIRRSCQARILQSISRSSVTMTEVTMRVRNGATRALALVVAATFAAGASAQQFVYPAKGQSPEQQKKDEGECHVWAAQQSKYDPTRPPQQTAAAGPPTTATGTTPGAGVRGAARGAVVGGIMGDAGAGACGGRRRGSRPEPAPERGAGATATAIRDAARPGGHGRVSESALGVSRRAWLYGEVGCKRTGAALHMRPTRNSTTTEARHEQRMRRTM